MNRRGFLGAVGVGLLVGTAGCGGGTPNDSSTPETDAASRSTAAPTPTSTLTATPTTYRSEFRRFLGETVHRIEAIAVDDRRVTLRYVTTKQGYQQLGGQIGAIAGGFYRQVDAGWDVDRLDATIHDEEGSERGTWYAKREWFEEYRNGDISADDLSLRVLDTLQQTD